MNACRGQRGFALIITLVITALLVALVVEFIDDVFVETSSRKNFVDSQQASIMANSGVEAAIKLLQTSLAGRSYTTLSDQWAKPIQFEDEKGSLRVTIEDESGKLNINFIVGENGVKQDFYYDIAARLLRNEGLSPDLPDAAADWLDPNDEPLPGGGESTYYMQLKPPYKVKNGKLLTFEELALVKGFDADIVNKLRETMTVYATELMEQININTAPPKVIAALKGMDKEKAKAVVDYRATTPFKSPIELTNVPGIGSIESTEKLKCTGSVYRIISEAIVNETTRTVEAVVPATTSVSQPGFLYWREF